MQTPALHPLIGRSSSTPEGNCPQFYHKTLLLESWLLTFASSYEGSCLPLQPGKTLITCKRRSSKHKRTIQFLLTSAHFRISCLPCPLPKECWQITTHAPEDTYVRPPHLCTALQQRGPQYAAPFPPMLSR